MQYTRFHYSDVPIYRNSEYFLGYTFMQKLFAITLSVCNMPRTIGCGNWWLSDSDERGWCFVYNLMTLMNLSPNRLQMGSA